MESQYKLFCTNTTKNGLASQKQTQWRNNCKGSTANILFGFQTRNLKPDLKPLESSNQAIWAHAAHLLIFCKGSTSKLAQGPLTGLGLCTAGSADLLVTPLITPDVVQ